MGTRNTENEWLNSPLSDEEENIEFIGFLVNCEASLSKIKLRHGFKVRSMSIDEIDKLFVSLDHGDSNSRLKQFFQQVRALADEGNLIAVTNRFHYWGNEEGYFADYDPSGPERDDAFLVEDYLRIVLRLAKLFKEGDLDMPLTIHYEIQDGVPHPSTYGGGDRLRWSRGKKYSVTDFEIPGLQQLLDRTAFPFKRGYVQLAFDFFEMSYALRVPSLIFLVLMISLEVLFNSDERGGIHRRICTNLSRLLGERAADRERIYSHIWTLYDKRSMLVHQGLYDYQSYLHRVAPDFEKAASEFPRRERDPRFIQPGDYLRLRNYVRSSVMQVLALDLDKEALLKHLSRPSR